MLLLSPPGCGKSQFCKSLGKEVGRPVLILDVGSLMGSLVGQSEERTRQALRIIDAMAPCVAMIDEVEKAFAGMNGKRRFGRVVADVRDVLVVAQRSRVGRVRGLHGQRRVEAATGVRKKRAVSTASSSSTCPAGRRRTRSGTSTSICSRSTAISVCRMTRTGPGPR